MTKEERASYYINNREKRIAYDKEYRQTHKIELALYREHTKKGREADRLRARCKKVDITVDYYNSLPKKCSFEHCESTEAGGRGDWHLDHDHVTGKFRGLLCSDHNLGLGRFHDNINELQDAIDYLRGKK